jgi:hypothetical protein
VGQARLPSLFQHGVDQQAHWICQVITHADVMAALKPLRWVEAKPPYADPTDAERLWWAGTECAAIAAEAKNTRTRRAYGAHAKRLLALFRSI